MLQGARRRLAALFELQPGTGRNPAMEGLRGLAVTLVFFVHYHSCLEPWVAGASGALSDLGWALRFMGAAGVDLFFVLSGFLIAGATRSERFSWGRFLQRRVQRLYPTFLVMLALYLGLSLLMPSVSKLPPDRTEAALYVLQNALLLPGMFAIEPLITVAWSLSYEVFFYLALPILMVTLGLRRAPASTRLTVFALLAAGVVALPLMGLGHVQLLLFLGGMAVSELRERVAAAGVGALGHGLRRGSVVVALLSLPAAYWIFEGALALGGTEPTAFMLRSVWLTFAFSVLVAGVLTGQGAIARLCSWTPLRWLGNMSYAYYLVHGLVLKAVALVALRLFVAPETGALAAFWLLMPVAFAATLVAAGVLFAWVEKPFSLGGPLPWPLSRTGPEVAVAVPLSPTPRVARSVSNPWVDRTGDPAPVPAFPAARGVRPAPNPLVDGTVDRLPVPFPPVTASGTHVLEGTCPGPHAPSPFSPLSTEPGSEPPPPPDAR